MKAIVLSFDKNHPFCELMYRKYMELWPDCPFTFRIPWNEKSPTFFENKSNVELIQCDKHIRLTAEALLGDIDDDEWVYWCIDDRFPIYINTDKINTFHENVTGLEELDYVKAFNHKYVCTRGGSKTIKPQPLRTGRNITDNLAVQKTGPEWGFYMHHYCRARVLKSVFISEGCTHIDEFHRAHICRGPKQTGPTIKNLKGAVVIEKSLIDFREPCIDGVITIDGLDYLSEMNIEHEY